MLMVLVPENKLFYVKAKVVLWMDLFHWETVVEQGIVLIFYYIPTMKIVKFNIDTYIFIQFSEILIFLMNSLQTVLWDIIIVLSKVVLEE